MTKVSPQTAHPALPNVIKELNARHLKRGGAALLTYIPAHLLVDVPIYLYKILRGHSEQLLDDGFFNLQ